MKKLWIRRLAWGAGGIALLWVALWLAVPPVLKWQLQTRVSALLGREVMVESVRFQPWNLDLVLNGVNVAAASGDEPLLHVERLRGNLSVSSLWRLAPVIEALEIDRLRLRVARLADGRYDVDDLIERFTPRADESQAATEPARFALYNVEVRDAALRFDDRPAARVHEVQDLHLALPFLSNLPAQLEVKVLPRLAFKLNGVAFDSRAETTPFADDHETLLRLKVDDLDVTPYLGYMPKALPVRLVRGMLSSDLALQFREVSQATPSVVLSGTLGARALALQDAAGAPLAAWQQLQLGLREVQPLARKLVFDSLRLDGAELHVTRDAAGRINLLNLQAASSKPAAAASSPSNGTPSPWQVSISALELTDARVSWDDAAVKPTAALVLDGLSLQARQLQWPATGPMPLSLQATLRAQGNNAQAAGQLAAKGNANGREAKLDLTLTDLSLEVLSPYVAQVLAPRVQGRLSAKAQLDWAANVGEGEAAQPRIKLGLTQATLDDLRVVPTTAGRHAVRDGATLRQLALADAQVDVTARTMALGKVTFTQPVLSLARDAGQRLNVQQWLRADDSSGSDTPTTESPPWRVQLDQLVIERGQVGFTDEAVLTRGEPTRLELDTLQASLQQLVWQGERQVQPAKVQLSARIASGSANTAPRAPTGGTLEWKGELGLAPLQARGQLQAVRVPVQAFAAYAADQVPVTVLRAEAGYSGQVAVRQTPAGFDAEAAGDVLVGDVHVSTPAGADELLSWQALALKRLQFKLKPDTKPQIEIGEVALSDFYSRLVVTEEGRFNVQGVRPASTAASAPAPASAPQTADRTADAPLSLDVRIGGIRLTNGRVDFTDRFVRPNYSAELTDLNGRLGAFGSASREMADVQLTGRVAGTGRLDIGGRINPTVKPLAMDVQARAADIELSPLSPYAGKYAGYGIERGKLSVDVAYRIDTDGRLEANNRVVLNQLTFGERIDSPTATKLPVLLAVALLKDHDGVIDVNLPVSGSLNDPEFSIGGLIGKLIVNLLAKALTSPFALLAGGGGEESNQVDFAPGTTALSSTSAQLLDKVARALAERPALKMTIVGTADLTGEREAWQRAQLETRLLAERRKELLRTGAEPDAATTLTADDRARLLKALYQQTESPAKPRNALGLAKDIPPAQMEALLRQQIPATPEAMRELAQQRGLVVRDALVAKGLPSERLFLGAPKPSMETTAPNTSEGAGGARALLSLTLQ